MRQVPVRTKWHTVEAIDNEVRCTRSGRKVSGIRRRMDGRSIGTSLAVAAGGHPFGAGSERSR